MASSSPETIQKSFNILGYSLLLLGIYTFHFEPAKKKKFYRILQMIYCSIITLIHSFLIVGIAFVNSIYFLIALRFHNIYMIAYYVSSLATLKACLVQRTLFHLKSRDILSYINDWRNFEIEYKSFTGKRLNAVSFKKSLIIFFLSTPAVLFVTVMTALSEIRLSNKKGSPSDDFSSRFSYFLSPVFYSVIYLMRLYTELMWYMFCNALRNSAVQLADDYKNDLYRDRSLDITHYEYLWTKLAKLHSRLTSTLSQIYGYQLAINFLQLLFHGFVFFEFIFRYMTIEILIRVLKNLLFHGFFFLELIYSNMTIETWVRVLQDPNEWSHLTDILFGLHGQTTICLVYLWLGSTTAGSAQKALVDNTKQKLLGILSDNALSDIVLHEQGKRFIKKIMKNNTKIMFNGYGIIDRHLFCTILITWINYMIILLQFKSSFYGEDMDDTMKETAKIKRSVPNVESIEFQNYL